jgi:hypothetical protein
VRLKYGVQGQAHLVGGSVSVVTSTDDLKVSLLRVAIYSNKWPSNLEGQPQDAGIVSEWPTIRDLGFLHSVSASARACHQHTSYV